MGFFEALLRGMLGLAVLVGLGYLLSTNRKAINWRLVGSGIGLQLIFGLLILKTSWGFDIFEALGAGFAQILAFTNIGGDFVFAPFGETTIQYPMTNFAFRVLPTIIFFAALMALLYHLKLIQPIVRVMGKGMAKTMKLSGAESLAAAANVFIGQTEAPLVVRPFVHNMTKSELMTLMCGGMATIAGGVLAAYVGMLGGESEAQQAMFAAHLISASLMSAPAAIVMAKIIVPETEEPQSIGVFKLHEETTDANAIEATAAGAGDGLKLAANVGAMLLAFIALIAMLNAILGWMGKPMIGGSALYDLNGWIAGISGGQFSGLSLESIFGYVFAPLAWGMGVESADILQFGRLMGEKIVVTEFIAYASLSGLTDVMSERSMIMGTYALCGFANFGSIAIQIGGIGGIAPERRGDIARFGVRAMFGGALASWMTATVAGVLVG